MGRTVHKLLAASTVMLGVSAAPRSSAVDLDPTYHFVSRTLATTEDIWRAEFQKFGAVYEDPILVLFSEQTPSGCGEVSADASYCVMDDKIYLEWRHVVKEYAKGDAGKSAIAYAIGLNVAHHIQARLNLDQSCAVAHCLLGLWAARAGVQTDLENGPLREHAYALGEIHAAHPNEEDLRKAEDDLAGFETGAHAPLLTECAPRS